MDKSEGNKDGEPRDGESRDGDSGNGESGKLLKCGGIAFISGRYYDYNSEVKVIDDIVDVESPFEVFDFDKGVAKIKRGLGFTRHLNFDYEFVRSDVWIELPCHVEDIEKCDKFARKWVGERNKEVLAAVKKWKDRNKKENVDY